MCAIVGFWNSSAGAGEDELVRTARRMASALQHRGPDDEGVWADETASLALGHRRLAILDLTSEGHQPMHSADGRYVLTFNGEIYNFQPLRDDLEQRGHSFRGHSDTEVMLAAFCEWGVRLALERFAGMFAFAVWDRQERKLHLARDRAGEKPLYYGWTDGVWVFGSELNALRVHPRWRAEISRDALSLFIRYGCIPAPHSIYENICKLPPGCVVTLAEADIHARRAPEPVAYWSAQAVAEAGATNPFKGNVAEATGQLRELLLQSVGRQMVADVPLGAFLSGGIDSSLVVAMMQAQSPRPIKTFSIGFHQDGFNEAGFAKSVAAHLGTDHTELYFRDRDLQQVIPRLSEIYDEPFADSSQIPTALLCQLARASVKVSLSGDGGDELFGGYNHYRIGQRLWKVMSWIPESCRQPLARQLKRVARAGLNLPITNGRANRMLNRLWSLSDVLSRVTDYSLYQMLMSSNRETHLWLKEAVDSDVQSDAFPVWRRLPELLQRMMCHDLVYYLPNDILVKVDRAAMAVGLETRIPLLDHQIIEFAFRLPTSFKQRGSCGKWLLRQILYQYVPPALVDRPKSGFGAPIAEWLRGSLSEWADDLLGETRLCQEGFFEARQIRQKWREHLDLKRNWSTGLWHVLMFQAWLDEQKMASHRTAGFPPDSPKNILEAEPCRV